MSYHVKKQVCTRKGSQKSAVGAGGGGVIVPGKRGQDDTPPPPREPFARDHGQARRSGSAGEEDAVAMPSDVESVDQSHHCPHCQKPFTSVPGLRYHVNEMVCRKIEKAALRAEQRAKDAAAAAAATDGEGDSPSSLDASCSNGRKPRRAAKKAAKVGFLYICLCMQLLF